MPEMAARSPHFRYFAASKFPTAQTFARGSDETRKSLSEAISDAGFAKFEVIDGDVPMEANQAAEALYLKLEAIGTSLISHVRSQSSL